MPAQESCNEDFSSRIAYKMPDSKIEIQNNLKNFSRAFCNKKYKCFTLALANKKKIIMGYLKVSGGRVMLSQSYSVLVT